MRRADLVILSILVALLIVTAIVTIGIEKRQRTTVNTTARFIVQRDETSDRPGECRFEVITDRTNGCQYLQVCTSVTSMPGTCKTVSVNELRKEVTK